MFHQIRPKVDCHLQSMAANTPDASRKTSETIGTDFMPSFTRLRPQSVPCTTKCIILGRRSETKGSREF